MLEYTTHSTHGFLKEGSIPAPFSTYYFLLFNIFVVLQMDLSLPDTITIANNNAITLFLILRRTFIVVVNDRSLLVL